MRKIWKIKARGRTPRRQPGVMNRLEAAYAREVLEPRKLAGEIIEFWFEAVTLKLAPDTRYTPDFMVQLASGELELHETKGFMRDDANVKLKIAAKLFPFSFFLIKKQTKKDGGSWEIKEIPFE